MKARLPAERLSTFVVTSSLAAGGAALRSIRQFLFTGMPLVTRAVRANAGVTARYRKQMAALIDEMSNSVLYWLTSDVPGSGRPVIAQDESPVARRTSATEGAGKALATAVR